MKKYAQIVGWGMYAPQRILTNHDLEKMVDTSDEWIRRRVGIGERHICAPGEATASMATRAARAALEVADLSPSKLDLIIVATVTPDYQFPSAASIVQDALGASHAAAFDLNAGCAGFVYGLYVALGMIGAELYRNVMVIGSDTLSRITDFQDRSTAVLFGDGAGAVLLTATDQPTGVLSCVLGSDGSGAEALLVPAGGSRHPATVETVQNRQHFIRMNGAEVYRFAVKAMADGARQVVQMAGLQIEDIKLVIPHQANIRIMEAAAKALKLRPDQLYCNVERYGNTSAATIPIALCEALAEGRIKPGDYLLLVGFGAGLTWAAAVVQWGAPVGAASTPWWRSVLHDLRGREAAVRSLTLRTRRRLDSLRGADGRAD